MNQLRRPCAARIPLFCLLVALASPLRAGDWPHWRGPGRDDVVEESSGWEAGRWTLGEAAWSRGVGIGSTSPLVVGDQLFTMGWGNNQDHVVCLDADSGRPLWSVQYACPKYGRRATGDQGLYAGPCSTPEYDEATGFLYTLSIDGHLACWDTRRRGRRVWIINLYELYQAEQRPRVGRSGRRDYGYTTAPLLHGDWVVVEVGSRQGTLMAFDKRNGGRVWASQSKEPAGHTGGPVPIRVEGVPCVAALTHFHLLIARLDAGHEGETVAEFPWETSFANNIASPAVRDNFVLITSGYNQFAICKLEITLGGAREVWKQEYASKVCTPVIHGGHVYWCWREVQCLDFETGKRRWASPPDFGDPGSCIVTSDDRLIVLAKRGRLALAETAQRSPDTYRELARRDNLFSH